jgi:hypothetical protein
MKKDIKAEWLKNTENFIAKLEKLNYIKPDGKTLISEEGYEVSYRTEFLSNPPHADNYPVQVVIYVRKEGQHVQTWGCDSNESNRLFVNFFMRARARAYDAKYENEEVTRDLNEKEFWSL